MSYIFLDDKILDETGSEVMMDWETGIMEKHAEVVTENGGHILELGFGMGICSTFIQQHNIESHTIIEIHNQVFERLLEWAKDKPNVIPVKGDWCDNIPKGKVYDGIMYDTWKDKCRWQLIDKISPHTKEGTIFTMYNGYYEKNNTYNLDADYIIMDVEPTQQETVYFDNDKYYLPIAKLSPEYLDSYKRKRKKKGN